MLPTGVSVSLLLLLSSYVLFTQADNSAHCYGGTRLYPNNYNMQCQDVEGLECAPCQLNTTVATAHRRRRYEIRDLPEEQWESFVFAMREIHTLSMEEGKEKYGPLFKNDKYMTGFHAWGQTSVRGDQAHCGAHFFSFHSLYCLMFETVVMTITEQAGLPLEGVPYWWNFDDVDQSIILSEQYFGTHPGLGPEFEVTDGPFGNWTVPMYNESYPEFAANIVNQSDNEYRGNMFGYMRTGTNAVSTPYIVGYSSTENETNAPFIPPQLEELMYCLNCAYDSETFTIFHLSRCFDESWHYRTHAHLGGTAYGVGPELEDTHGDFYGPTASTTHPLFVPYHNTVDMFLMEWLAKYPEHANTTWGFPYKNAFCYTDANTYDGINAEDTVSSSFPITWMDVGWAEPGSADANNTVTHTEAICRLTKANAPYIYIKFNEAPEGSPGEILSDDDYRNVTSSTSEARLGDFEAMLKETKTLITESKTGGATDANKASVDAESTHKESESVLIGKEASKEAQLGAAEAFLSTYNAEADNQLQSAEAFIDALTEEEHS